MTAIADTSFIIAVVRTRDTKHEICVEVFKQYREIIMPQSVLAEVGYLLTQGEGNEGMARFLRIIPKSKYRLETLQEIDFARTAEILDTYADTRVDFVDATVAAVAERLTITHILTLDRRDFSIIRPTHRLFHDFASVDRSSCGRVVAVSVACHQQAERYPGLSML